MRAQPKIVYLYVPNGMADWEPGLAIAGINQPAFQLHPGSLAVRTAGLTRDPVRTAGGVTVLPDVALADVLATDSAMLILPGSNAWDEGGQGEAVEKAREFLAAGVPVAAICGATLGLAQGGLLDRRPHTSNAREYLTSAAAYRGIAHFVDSPAVRDGDLITATGVAPVEFARLIFERLGLYSESVLEAWHALYAHGDPAGFHALMAAADVGEG